MRVFKIKFADKESKEEFSKYTNQEILKEKKKSVYIGAKNKREVRIAIDEAERKSYHQGFGYCFGTENEDYSIKETNDDEIEIEV